MATRTFTIVTALRQPGTFTFGPFNVPNGVTQLVLTVPHDASWTGTGTEALRLRTEFSTNGGTTWQPTTPLGGFGMADVADGGSSGMTVSCQPNTQLRAFLTLLKALTVGATLVVS